MNRKKLHSKLNELLKNTTNENLLETINNIEYQINQCTNTSSTAIIPQEANFQLPTQFLGIKKNVEIEGLFIESNKTSVNDEKIDRIVTFLEETMGNESFSTMATAKNKKHNIEKLVKKKYFGV
ncbi:hypothetical protein EHP00_1742 [Ecytonucleospora hepatopenaei]|uniref:Uncharacterized protein n=1 Tax=Ecytonucleospora hepatopenaei TaxID=646526 RepID=A0A1W0E404_9MICR|nr:hypothetical protein EHP00_1742 [Ecytonucleospora hepatopenaei]